VTRGYLASLGRAQKANWLEDATEPVTSHP